MMWSGDNDIRPRVDAEAYPPIRLSVVGKLVGKDAVFFGIRNLFRVGRTNAM